MGKITMVFYFCNMWVLTELMSTFFSRRKIAGKWWGRFLVVGAAALLHYLLLPVLPAGTLLRTISYVYVTIAVVWVQHKGRPGRMAAVYGAFLGYQMLLEFTIRMVQESMGISFADATRSDMYFYTFCLQMTIELLLLVLIKYVANRNHRKQGEERGTTSGNIQISALIAQLDEDIDKEFTDHTALNILLNAKYARALKRGIKCQIDIQNISRSGIDQVDLLTIAGDILDYSIQGTELEFRMGTYKNALLMKCKSFLNPDIPMTVKLKEIAEKYDGSIEWKKNDDEVDIYVILWVRQ